MTCYSTCTLVPVQSTVEAYSQSVSGKCDVQLPSSVQEWADFTSTDGVRTCIYMYAFSTDYIIMCTYNTCIMVALSTAQRLCQV